MSNLNANQQWEIQQYLLNAPSFDRQEFEDRMLENPELAMAVAREVQVLEQISSMVTDSVETQPVRGKLASSYRLALYLASLAAAFLIIAEISQLVSDGNNISDIQGIASGPENGLEATADYWLGFENLEPVSEPSIIDVPSTFVSTDSGDEFFGADGGSEPDTDWMMDIAIGYFGELET